MEKSEHASESVAFHAAPTYIVPYLRLVSAFPLRPLRNDQDLEEAIEVLNAMIRIWKEPLRY
jgi:hypothetical protein